ncbi:hypothetical protein PUN28_001973 [Cardiocondyla obscurior]|uniref:Uncharacterized protein n=1 Tax=Cardiocondyla obscurior TaxID=286306 RepID=A0AAW2GS28_9HYME
MTHSYPFIFSSHLHFTNLFSHTYFLPHIYTHTHTHFLSHSLALSLLLSFHTLHVLIFEGLRGSGRLATFIFTYKLYLNVFSYFLQLNMRMSSVSTVLCIDKYPNLARLLPSSR